MYDGGCGFFSSNMQEEIGGHLQGVSKKGNPKRTINYKHLIENLALKIIVSCREIPYLFNDTFFVSVLSRTAEKHCLE